MLESILKDGDDDGLILQNTRGFSFGFSVPEENEEEEYATSELSFEEEWEEDEGESVSDSESVEGATVPADGVQISEKVSEPEPEETAITKEVLKTEAAWANTVPHKTRYSARQISHTTISLMNNSNNAMTSMPYTTTSSFDCRQWSPAPAPTNVFATIKNPTSSMSGPEARNRNTKYLLERFKDLQAKAKPDTAAESLIEPLNALISQQLMVVEGTQQAGDMSELGKYYRWRYRFSRSIDDIDHAIEYTSMAAAISFKSSKAYLNYSTDHCVCLRLRFDRIQKIADLNKAIKIANEVLKREHKGDGSQEIVSLLRRVYAAVLIRRYEHAGCEDSLNEARNQCIESMDTQPRNELDRVKNRLAVCYNHQYERYRKSEDLEAALKYAEEASQTASAEHLAVWAHVLLNKYWRSNKDMTYLNKALECGEAAVRAISGRWDDGQLQALNINAMAHSIRFQRSAHHDAEYIERAISYGTKCAELAPDEHPQRPVYLSNLSNYLVSKFKWVQVGYRSLYSHLLDNSILYASRAVEITGPANTSYASYLSNLSDKLRNQYDYIGDDEEVFNRAVDTAHKALDAKDAPLVHRADVALKAVPFLQKHEKWAEAYEIVRKGLEVLNRLDSQNLSTLDRQQILPRYAGLASRGAACAMAKDPPCTDDAVRLLQMGRNMIFNLQYRTRGDLSDLKDKNSFLYIEFLELQGALSKSFPGQTTTESSSQREYSQKFDDLVARIRKIDQMENFLLPPRTTDLMKAAGEHTIVIINISFRCDCFLVRRDSIEPLHLKGITEAEVVERAEAFKNRPADRIATLEWLWSHITEPVLKELGHLTEECPDRDDDDDEVWPRVYWIPTGALSNLPLHAAGFHYAPGNNTVLDRVISSYATSSKSLLYTSQNLNRAPKTPSSQKNSYILASLPTSEFHNLPPLPGVTKEIEALRSLLPTDSSSVVIDRSHPTRKQFLSDLNTCQILHYAGHATSSSFLLADGIATVYDLTKKQLYQNPPALAYLSACSTGANDDTQKQDDEGLHLMGACVLSGFSNVVGALWKIDDKVSVEVAKDFYSNFFGKNKGKTAEAVHKAVRKARQRTRDAVMKVEKGVGGTKGREVRLAYRDAQKIGSGGGENWEFEEDPDDELHWAAYIHMGV